MKLIVHSLVLVMISTFLMGASKCSVGGGAPDFEWNPELWFGDHETQSIVRKNDAGEMQQIHCSDRAFSSMVSVKATEIPKAKKAAQKLVNACEKWKAGASAAGAEFVKSLESMEADVQQFAVPESDQ